MLVKPAPDLRVRDPHAPRRFVGIGEDVDEHDLAWHRLIRDGDLVKCTAEEAAEAEAERIAAVAAKPEEPAESEKEG